MARQGLYEVVEGIYQVRGMDLSNISFVEGVTPEQLFDALAIQVDGPACWDDHLTLDIALTDGDTYRLRLRNGVLSYSSAAQSGEADMTLTLARTALLGVATGQVGPDDFADAGIEVAGDEGVLGRLLGVLQPGDPDFPILTPADAR